MTSFLLVATGGALGSIARYGMSLMMLRAARAGWLPSTGALSGWPWATLGVNVIGGLLMGALVGWLSHRGSGNSEQVRLFLGVGLLGGFTTFSAFSLEIMLMLQRKEWLVAGLYVSVSVVFSVGALLVGLALGRQLFGPTL